MVDLPLSEPDFTLIPKLTDKKSRICQRHFPARNQVAGLLGQKPAICQTTERLFPNGQ
jgi:hypothetical protein